MKFLHTADLHIGKRLNDVSLLEDQIDVLHQLLDLAISNQVDGVLLAGDIYQRSSPQGEAMTVFNDFVTALSDAHIKVFAISGNHDSDQRISYFSQLLKKSDIFVSEKFTGSLQQIELSDAYGPLVIHLLPFIRPFTVRKCFPKEEINTYQDAMISVLSHSHIDESKRNILICHQYMTGAQLSDSEELAIGGVEHMDAHLFDAFDYVALGHIHKPQKAGRPTCRYAGSPLPYSFSEAGQQKSAVLVEIKEKGNIQLELLPLRPPHEMIQLEGTLAEMMNRPHTDAYAEVTLTDELIPPDARQNLSTVFSHLMRFGVHNSRTKETRDVLAQEAMEEKTVPQLFSDFYRLQNNDVPPPSSHMEMLSEILKEMEEKGHEAP